jgi:hypothetical protein
MGNSENLRGTGRTTAQMRAAPQNAVFVWCNNHLHYPAALAKHLGRTDLEIVSPDWLNDVSRAQGGAVVVFDHGVFLPGQLDARQRAAVDEIFAAGQGRA